MIEHIKTRFAEIWEAQVQEELADERSQGYDDPSEWYVSGRSSKAYPGKEDKSWWFDRGPEFVASWVQWRDASPLEIWTTPDGKPGIEVETYATRGTLALKSAIDRVMVNEEGDLFIIDIKSGSQTPAWPRQMALNNLGLEAEYGVRARYAGFWNARKGTVDPWYDLRIYDADWLWRQVEIAREIRDRGLFAAQPTNLCNSACGVARYCRAVGGPLSLDVVQP